MAIDSDVNYVVQKAVEKLTADKDFQQWKAANADKLTNSPEASSQQKRGRKPKAEAVSISGKAVA